MIKTLLNKLAIPYKNLDLYELALTHASYRVNHALSGNYEKLEFLGDASLDLIVGELCYKFRPELDQGGLTKLRSALVKKESLIQCAEELNLEKYLKVGPGMELNHEKIPARILEDVFEAFVGAMYLDLGFNFTESFLSKIFLTKIIHYSIEDVSDYKSRLQEEIQSMYRKTVIYQLVSSSGPAHDPIFEVEVLFDGMVLGKGKGKSKKEAEQNAAKDALGKRAK